MNKFLTDVNDAINYISIHKREFVTNNCMYIWFNKELGKERWNERINCKSVLVRLDYIKTDSINYKSDLKQLSTTNKIHTYCLDKGYQSFIKFSLKIYSPCWLKAN